jgi:cell division septation protein DedD
MMDAVEDTIPSDGERYRSVRSSAPFLGPGARWLYVIAGALLAGLGLATMGYMVVTMVTGGSSSNIGDGPVPYVSADDQPFKVRPDDPGGMDIPNRGKHIYGVLRGEDVPNVERLLTQPEQPMPPPMPPASTADGSDPAEPAAVGDTASGALAMGDPDASRAGTGSSVAAFDEQAPTGPDTPANESRPSLSGVIMPQPRPSLASPAEPAVIDRAIAQSAAPSRTASAPSSHAPAASPTVTASAATTGSRGAASSGQAYRVQLIALRTQEQAEREWQRLVSTNRDLLGTLRPEVAQANLGSKGTVYRLRAGPVAGEAAARQLCKSLAQRKVGCLVIAPGA